MDINPMNMAAQPELDNVDVPDIEGRMGRAVF